jgi:hypothetical protein
VFSVGSFVMAANTVDGVGVKPNGWHCCASFDVTDWTPNVSTLSTRGQLVSSPGRITAGGRLGEYAVLYKERAIYLGQFVGAPAVWDFTLVIGGNAGCVGQDAWCDIDGAHFIVGIDGLFVFDGSRPQPVGQGEYAQWFFDNSNPVYRYKTQCIYDRQNQRVWVHYCSTLSSTLDSALVIHMPSKRVGHVTTSIESVLNYIGSGVTIDGMPAIAATIDGFGAYSFDSQFWISGGRFLAAFGTDHQLRSITGTPGASSVTTGDAGDDNVYTLLTMIRLRFLPGKTPSAAQVQTFTKERLGDDLTPATTVDIYDGRFDVLDSARWHRATFNFMGEYTVTHLGAALIPEGDV